jgi:cytochrome c oxidase subunit 3
LSLALRQPWDSLRRQREAASFGMWIFLGSEVMLFGGLMLALAVNRTLHPEAFAAAGRETNIVFGTANTAVLLTSSMAMAVGAEAARARLRRLAFAGMAVTVLLGLAFLVIKGVEWHEDISEHLVPGAGFKLHDPAAQLFFALYWIMTGLHGLHVSGGICVIVWLAGQAWRGARPIDSPVFEGAALYWHLVDIVWVFLYPLLYLGGRA